MEQTTIVKKILYLTAILLSLAMIWYFIWSWITIVNIAIDYSTALTTSDKAAVLEVRPHFYLPYLGILIQFSLGFGYVVDWLTRAIIGFKNSLKKRSELEEIKMLTPEELKQRRATLIKELKELDNQIQQAERTLQALKKTTIKQRFKQLLGGLLKLMIWLSFFLARTSFFYYFLHSVIQWSLIALLLLFG